MKSILSLIGALTFAALAKTSDAQSPATGATVINSNKVAAAFAKGMPLLETSEYKIHASRRDAPGVAEIHTRDTDIIHVLEGSADRLERVGIPLFAVGRHGLAVGRPRVTPVDPLVRLAGFGADGEDGSVTGRLPPRLRPDEHECS